MKRILPNEYDESHEYCFFLHDRIGEVIVIGEKYRLFDEKIIFRNEKDAQEFKTKRDGQEIIDWLELNNYKNELNSLYLKQVSVALISDFCHFIYEALTTSLKGKTTVSFALLRKPLKDNLFILENILVNKDNFYEGFNKEKGFIDLANDKVNEEMKKSIIDKVLKHLNLEAIIEKDFIYDIRYNKKCKYGFEPLWQQANHLITTCKHYQTKKGNINFIFSDLECKHTQWKLLYYLLPTLLFYTFKIVMRLSLDVIGLEFVPERGADIRVIMGFLKLYIEDKSLLKNYDFKCDKCGYPLKISNIPMKVITSGKIKCKRCNKIILK